MRDEQEQPKQQPRRVTQRLCVPLWIVKIFGRWVDSAEINLTESVPLENYSVPVETVRQVER